jgi:hypothetical protein
MYLICIRTETNMYRVRDMRQRSALYRTRGGSGLKHSGEYEPDDAIGAAVVASYTP